MRRLLGFSFSLELKSKDSSNLALSPSHPPLLNAQGDSPEQIQYGPGQGEAAAFFIPWANLQRLPGWPSNFQPITYWSL